MLNIHDIFSAMALNTVCGFGNKMFLLGYSGNGAEAKLVDICNLEHASSYPEWSADLKAFSNLPFFQSETAQSIKYFFLNLRRCYFNIF